MTPDQVRNSVVRGTLTGYVRLAFRLGFGLVLFRVLYQSLTPEQFGFWSLLWAFFGYGVLLDFGFGSAAQKRVAELSLHRDWPRLSEVLSTLMVAYAAVALGAAVLGLACADSLIRWFHVSPANHAEFGTVLRVFVVGTCVAFPLAVAPEILQGQQRVATANLVATAALLANFLSIVLGIHHGFSLLTLVVLALLSSILPFAFAAWLALRHLPEVRLHPRLATRHALVETARFSLFAYFNQLGIVLRNKLDQPVIAGVLGTAAVAPFQPGSKIGEMFGLVTRQIADVLSPAAAHLHARGDADGLRRLFVHGVRYSVLAATPLYVLTAVFMDPLLTCLTGIPHPEATMHRTGQLLLLWYYSLAITHWVFKRMFLMAGQERRVMWLALAETALNLALSVSLTVWQRSILGVAIGSLVPTLLLGWGVLWGWAAKESGLGRLELFRRVVLPAWLACLPMALAGLWLRRQSLWPPSSTVPLFLAELATLALLGFAGIAWLGLTATERQRARDWIRRRLPSSRTV